VVPLQRWGDLPRIEDALVKTVGVIAHPRRNCSEVFAAVIGWAQERDVQLLTLPEVRTELLPSVERVQPAELVASADLVLAAGGDGTILRALSLAAPARVPVLGVNLGRLAFLAEVDPSDVADALTQIERGSHEIEERLALDCRWQEDGRDICVRAFNDVVLVRSPGHGEAALAVSVGGQLFARFAADGVIAATPTGSTAYTLSAGGPIVSPLTEAILVTPIAPHGLFSRTLAIAASEQLRIDVLPSGGNVVVESDGTQRSILEPGAAVTVAASDTRGLLVRLGSTTFYARARRKLQLTDPLDLSSDDRAGP
jgi:NAD+ kinase